MYHVRFSVLVLVQTLKIGDSLIVHPLQDIKILSLPDSQSVHYLYKIESSFLHDISINVDMLTTGRLYVILANVRMAD